MKRMKDISFFHFYEYLQGNNRLLHYAYYHGKVSKKTKKITHLNYRVFMVETINKPE